MTKRAAGWPPNTVRDLDVRHAENLRMRDLAKAAEAFYRRMAGIENAYHARLNRAERKWREAVEALEQQQTPKETAG